MMLDQRSYPFLICLPLFFYLAPFSVVGQAITRPGALHSFQVTHPPVVPKTKSCEKVLLQHVFGVDGYTTVPFSAEVKPPTDCGKPGSWSSVVFNLTGTSQGRQYDRQFTLLLNDIEVWIGTTPEPTLNGVVWTTLRDMTNYMPLLSQPNSKVSVNIPNYTSPKLNLTGVFEVTLSAKFYEAEAKPKALGLAEQIIGLPGGLGQMIQIPKNTATAFVEIFAHASSSNEFWYANVLDKYMASTGESGGGPFREVQLWIDNVLAGVAYPCPMVYTGGVVLSFWRPIVAIGVYDEPSYTMDITPFIPLLSDSKPHNFSMVVEGQGANRSTGAYWAVNGSVSITLDPSGKRTTGNITKHLTESHVDFKPISKSADPNPVFLVTADRTLTITADVITGSGKNVVEVNQKMKFSNKQTYTDNASRQVVAQTSSGTSTSKHKGKEILSDIFSYPFDMDSSSKPWKAHPTGTEVDGKIDHSYNRQLILPFPAGTTSKITTRQKSEGSLFFQQHQASIGIGRTSQVYDYSDGTGATYHRDVEIFNITQVIKDVQSGTLAPVSPSVTLSNTGGERGSSSNYKDDISGIPVRTIKDAGKLKMQT